MTCSIALCIFTLLSWLHPMTLRKTEYVLYATKWDIPHVKVLKTVAGTLIKQADEIFVKNNSLALAPEGEDTYNILRKPDTKRKIYLQICIWIRLKDLAETRYNYRILISPFGSNGFGNTSYVEWIFFKDLTMGVRLFTKTLIKSFNVSRRSFSMDTYHYVCIELKQKYKGPMTAKDTLVGIFVNNKDVDIESKSQVDNKENFNWKTDQEFDLPYLGSVNSQVWSFTILKVTIGNVTVRSYSKDPIQIGCRRNPCQNGGKCINSYIPPKGESCLCDGIYGGKFCENSIPKCTPTTCKNFGTCAIERDSSGAFITACTCSPGYFGKFCESSVPLSSTVEDKMAEANLITKQDNILQGEALKYLLLQKKMGVEPSFTMYMEFENEGISKVLFNTSMELPTKENNISKFSEYERIPQPFNDSNDPFYFSETIRNFSDPGVYTLNVIGYNKGIVQFMVIKAISITGVSGNFSVLTSSLTVGVGKPINVLLLSSEVILNSSNIRWTYSQKRLVEPAAFKRVSVSNPEVPAMVKRYGTDFAIGPDGAFVFEKPFVFNEPNWITLQAEILSPDETVKFKATVTIHCFRVMDFFLVSPNKVSVFENNGLNFSMIVGSDMGDNPAFVWELPDKKFTAEIPSIKSSGREMKEKIGANMEFPETVFVWNYNTNFHTSGNFTCHVVASNYGAVQFNRTIVLQVIAPMSDITILTKTVDVEVQTPVYFVLHILQKGEDPAFRWTFGPNIQGINRTSLTYFDESKTFLLLDYLNEDQVKKFKTDTLYDVVDYSFQSMGEYTVTVIGLNKGAISKKAQLKVKAIYKAGVYSMASQLVAKIHSTVTIYAVALQQEPKSVFILEIGRQDPMTLSDMIFSMSRDVFKDVGMPSTLLDKMVEKGFYFKTINITLKVIGELPVKLVVKEEDVITTTKEIIITTVEKICDYKISVTNAGGDLATAVYYHTSDHKYFAIEGLMDCDQRTLSKRIWTLHKLESNDIDPPLDQRNKVNLPSSVEQEGSVFDLPEGIVKVGLYVVKVELQIKQGSVKSTSVSKGWFKVMSGQFEARIDGGDYFNHYYMEPLTIDASESSFDNSSAMTIKWYCSSVPEVDPAGLCKGLSEVISNGSLELKFPAEKFRPDSTYTFRFVLQGTGRYSKPDVVDQIVRINARGTLKISCRYNCAVKINPDDKFLLEAHCTNCEQLIFLWELHSPMKSYSKQGAYTQADIMNETCFEYGKNSDRLMIKPKCLIPGGQYKVKLRGTAQTFTLDAKYEFLVNIPPKAGECNVTPSSGETMKTRFSVSCSEFKDVDMPVSYSFIFDNNYSYNSTVENNLPRGHPGYLLVKRFSTQIENMFLPIGNPYTNYSSTITIQATDCHGASVSVVKDVTVGPFSDLTVEIFSYLFASNEEGSFSDMLYVQGDIEGALNMVVCGAQLLKTEDAPDISSKERSMVKSRLIDHLKDIPAESFGKAKQMLFVLDTILDGDPDDISPETAGKASDLLDRLTHSLREHIEDEKISGVVPFKTALIAMSAASSLFTVGSVLDTTPTVITNKTKPPETEERKQLCKAGAKVLDVFEELSDVMMDQVIEGEDQKFATIKDINLRMEKADSKREISPSIGVENVAIANLPLLSKLKTNDSSETVFEMTALVLPSNPHMCSESADILNTYLLTIDVDAVTDEGKTKVKDISSKMSEKMSFFIKRRGLPESVKGSITTKGLPRLDLNNVRIYQFPLTSENITTHILIERNNTNFTLLLTWTFENSPEAIDFKETQFIITKDHPPKHLLTVLPEDEMTLNEGVYYVGILPYTEGVNYELGRSDALYFNETNLHSVLDYNITIFVSRCLYHEGGAWKEEGCKVTNKTTIEMIACDCEHFSLFGGSFLVVPNKLDLTKIPELFATASQNLIVIIFMSICWLLFIIALIWAVRRDKYDVANRRILYLEDNKRTDHFGYVIVFQTGLRWNAGTTSKISIKLHGKRYVTREISITSKERVILQTGCHDWFFFINDIPLKDIVGLRLFILFQGSRPNWYLSQIRIKDLTTGNFWVFLVNEWFIADENDGRVDEYYVPLTAHELRKFHIVLERRVVDDLRDRHLWFSIFSIPSRSTFSRGQRLMAAFSILILTMLLNIMFYEAEPENPAWFVKKHELYIIEIDVLDIIIALESALIAFPFGFFIMELFMRVKYSEGSFNDQIAIVEEITETGKTTDTLQSDYSTSSGESLSSEKSVRPRYPTQVAGKTSHELMQKLFSRREYNFIPSTDENFYAKETTSKPSLAVSSSVDAGKSFGDGLFEARDYHYPIPMWTWMDFSPSEIVEALEDTDMDSEEMRCKRIYLPPCFAYVGWIIAFGASATCTFFIMLYGLTYGYQKSLGWLKKNVFALGQSTVLIDPLHVFVFAIITTYCVEFTSSL